MQTTEPCSSITRCCRSGRRSHLQPASNTSIVVGGPAAAISAPLLDYEGLLRDAEPLPDHPDPDERTAAAMCYTTGTTGKPKGVLYSHRALVLHLVRQLAFQLSGDRRARRGPSLSSRCFTRMRGAPHTATMMGSGLVLPGPHLDPASLVELLARERVTVTAGVPTIWMGILQLPRRQPWLPTILDASHHDRWRRRAFRRP